ncbi:MAG: hypothetical protein ACK5N8_05160 [Alphaproteobacteria bacterium]
MYIWVVLATFMVAIYSFNLSVRADMKDIYASARIEPTITKLTAQHEAAKKYAYSHTPPSNGQAQVTYVPGEITFNDIKTYLPYGFKDNISTKTYRSLIYCLRKSDETGSSLLPGCSSGNPTGCCTGGNAQAFLITFGCIPQKFRNPYTKGYSVDFIKSLRDVSGYGADVGYVQYLSSTEKNDENNDFKSDMAIRTRNFDIISIPNYIVKNATFNSSTSFGEYCGDLRLDEDGNLKEDSCGACLAQLSRLSI